MASLGTKYGLLKSQYVDLRARMELLQRENEELRRNGGSSSAPSGRQRSRGKKAQAEEEAQEEEEEEEYVHVRAEDLEIDPSGPDAARAYSEANNAVVQYRVETLLASLSRFVSRGDAAAERDAADLARSWQFRFRVFCMHGDGTPGFLCVLLHSAVFVVAGPRRDEDGLVSVTFNYGDLRGVAVRPWGVRHAVSLELLLKPGGDHLSGAPQRGGGTDPSGGQHTFWGLPGDGRDLQAFLDSVSASVLGGERAAAAAAAAAEGRAPAAAAPPSERREVVVEVYETERYLTQLLGWSGAYLFPRDPPRWSDRTGSKFRTREAVGASLPRGWEWTSEWAVDAGVVAVVASVAPGAGSPAAAASLEAGDIVLRFYAADLLVFARSGGRRPLPVQALPQLREAAAAAAAAGRPLELHVFRPSADAYLNLFVSPAAGWCSGAYAGDRLLGCEFAPPGSDGLLSGWEYAPDACGPFAKLHRPNHFVRRRRWVRRALAAPGFVPGGRAPAALSSGSRRVARRDLGYTVRQPADPQSALVRHVVMGVGAGAGHLVGRAASALFSGGGAAPAEAAAAGGDDAADEETAAGGSDAGADGSSDEYGYEVVAYEISGAGPDDPFGLRAAGADPDDPAAEESPFGAYA